jgi:uncharacterized membrane protein
MTGEVAVKEFFQGGWLGHPLHPLLVELPVSLWPAALVLDVLTRLDIGANVLVNASFVAVLLGVLAAVPAAVAGVIDWSGVKQRNPAWRVGLYHLGMNATATVLALVSLVLRIPDLGAEEVGSLALILLAGSALLVAISGYLGGRMVYEYGVSVARLTKDYWRRVAEEGGADSPAKKRRES